mmetsp:Transcript_48476/g.95096  ORF Transcript_48476/g.95096 Transcript_48476/m.95096 type:complete len:557 (+) Transcript_48476:67-1737(+)|eukprot:CAMPEP_0175139844 /NCGR_PEP_ID=MMETSP0087-20121206/11140_1 /TAXON_ID=136419 /ORGANISM="Unknown Unknown, Strain D1" /LENGTH=556 /DNA_ID=CAMNT_0016422923 /DNA_START=67 /DNA_END=1737 /DNA_ORIENTATION=-
MPQAWPESPADETAGSYENSETDFSLLDPFQEDAAPSPPNGRLGTNPATRNRDINRTLARAFSAGALPVDRTHLQHRVRTRSALLKNRTKELKIKSANFLENSEKKKLDNLARYDHHVYNTAIASVSTNLGNDLKEQRLEVATTPPRVVKHSLKKVEKLAEKIGWTPQQLDKNRNCQHNMANLWTSEKIRFAQSQRGDDMVLKTDDLYENLRMLEPFYSSFSKDFKFVEPDYTPHLRHLKRIPAPRENDLLTTKTSKSILSNSKSNFGRTSSIANIEQDENFPVEPEARPFTPSSLAKLNQKKVVYNSRPQTAASTRSMASRSGSLAHSAMGKTDILNFEDPSRRPMSAPVQRVAPVRRSMMEILESRSQSRVGVRSRPGSSNEASSNRSTLSQRQTRPMSAMAPAEIEGVRSSAFQHINSSNSFNEFHSGVHQALVPRPESRQSSRGSFTQPESWLTRPDSRLATTSDLSEAMNLNLDLAKTQPNSSAVYPVQEKLRDSASNKGSRPSTTASHRLSLAGSEPPSVVHRVSLTIKPPSAQSTTRGGSAVPQLQTAA